MSVTVLHVHEQSPMITGERYAASLTAIRALGELALSDGAPSFELTATPAYDDFVTRAAEMLKTDPELSSRVDVNRTRTFYVEDNKVCATDGTPMVDVVRNGLMASQNAEDERLRTVQATRDEGDVIVAEMVDQLEVGESLIAVSVEPKNELTGSDAAFWRGMGYRQGIAYIQWYNRTSEDEMSSSAYSVDHSNFAVWCKLLRDRGVSLPDDVEPNTFIRNVWRFRGDEEEAMQRARALRQDSYEQTGASHSRLSIDGYLRTNESLIKEMFRSYYPLIAQSLLTGQNRPELQTFAKTVLESVRPDKLSSSALRNLLRIANGAHFTDDMARTIDELIPYALVEQLRQDMLPPDPKKSFSIPAPTASSYSREWHAMQQLDLQRLVVAGLATGISAGRQYGGCSPTTIVAANTPNADERTSVGQQDVYGGKGTENSREDTGPDGKGPLRFKCTEGHWNTRKPGQLLTECQHTPCKKGSVGCK